MTIYGSPIPEHRSHVGVGFAVLVGLAVALVSALFVGGARTANQASGLIAFARADGIYVMRADGTGARRISVSDVYVMKTNGTGLRLLTRGGGWVGSGQPAWSPDGQKVVFARPSGIWVMNANGDAQMQLTHHALDEYPAWSSSGRIAFVRTLVRKKVMLPAARDASSEIYVMNADGTGVTRLTHNRVGEASPAWQPIPPRHR